MIDYFKKYLHYISIPVSWTIIILILLSLPGSMLPNETTFKIANLDKIVHAGLFGGFVFLWGLHFSAKNISQKRLLKIFFYIFIIGSVYGTAMEFVQKYFIPSRDFELGDILADIAGASIAYGICNICLITSE